PVRRCGARRPGPHARRAAHWGRGRLLGGWFTATALIAGHGWYHAPLSRGPWLVFLLYMAPGHLPALFALPAGLGDIPPGLAAARVAGRLARGTGRRAAVWFTAFGLTDLVLALILGAITAFGLLAITPSGAPITELPLALIPTAVVPLLFALHITSLQA